MFELKIVTHFSAAHNLTEVAKKCENLHGHNWKIEACIKGKNLDKAGVLLDFGILKEHINAIMDELDHKYLNDLPMFKEKSPSSENIAIYIAERLGELIKETPATVSRIAVWESENSCATYIL